jgi:hypothetical protein
MADQYDVIAVAGTYEKDGEEKNRFLRLGVAFAPKGKTIDISGITIKLDGLPLTVDGRRSSFASVRTRSPAGESSHTRLAPGRTSLLESPSSSSGRGQ